MFASRGWMRFALFCNLLGAAFLFLSFQATSSNVRIMTQPGKDTTAFCAYETTIIMHGSQFVIGGLCPTWPNVKPIALVSIEYPKLVTAGFVLTLLGFMLQWFSFPSEPKPKPTPPDTSL
jgi:hypothetical protein